MQLTRDLAPTFFVLGDDGHLHGYDRTDHLRGDLATNGPPLRIFKLQTNTLTISYRPIEVTEIIPSKITPGEPVALLTA
jgi:hypothetical protein